jgi:hypothetical protein
MRTGEVAGQYGEQSKERQKAQQREQANVTER